MLVGTKLEHVVSSLALEIKEQTGPPTRTQVKPRDDLFWFRKPEILLRLIQFIIFQVIIISTFVLTFQVIIISAFVLTDTSLFTLFDINFYLDHAECLRNGDIYMVIGSILSFSLPLDYYSKAH